MKHQQLLQLCEAYALGALDENDRQQLESHLHSSCDECAAKLSEFKRVVTALGLSTEPVAPPPQLKNKILAQVMQGSSAVESPTPQSPFYFVRSQEGQWQTIAPGVTAKILFADTQHSRTTMLLRMAAGSRFSSHRHGSAEELFVLEGDCLCQGQMLHAGDYHRAEGGSTHGVTSTKNGCMMLVVSPEIEIV